MIDFDKYIVPTDIAKTSVGQFIHSLSSEYKPKVPDERLINLAVQAAKEAKLI